jgi:hypothetical protein
VDKRRFILLYTIGFTFHCPVSNPVDSLFCAALQLRNASLYTGGFSVSFAFIAIIPLSRFVHLQLQDHLISFLKRTSFVLEYNATNCRGQKKRTWNKI